MIDLTAFPGAPSDSFWSASPLAGSASDAWFVAFGSGGTHYHDAFAEFFAFCCRG